MSKYYLSILLLIVQFSFAQINVSGLVTSKDDGQPLPGVSVVIEGTQKGTTTDFDGKYSIEAKSEDVLVFSFIGMITKKVTVTGSTTGNIVINIVMESDTQVLEDVVVTALGITKKQKALGYAVQKVEGEDISSAGKANFMDALNGQVSGVQITSAGGQAGGGTGVIIRGMTSINYNNQPLYVVDGMPINNDKVNMDGWSANVGTNRAADLNPDEIASITVLKGGAATALYGSRAANGAIIITTKRGRKGQGQGINVSYSTSYSVDMVNKMHEFTDKYARGRNGNYSNVTHWSWGPAYAAKPKFPSGTRINELDDKGVIFRKDMSGKEIPYYDNNYGKFWRDGQTFKHSISASGGGKNSSFYFSAGTLNQDGITPNQNYFRNSILLNVSQDITDYFKLTGKANYINTGGKSFRMQTGILEGLGYFHHMFDSKGHYKDVNGEKTWFSGTVPHPNWIVNEEGTDRDLKRFISNVQASFEVNDYLGFDMNVGLDTYHEKRIEVRPRGSANTSSREGDMTDFRIRASDLNVDLVLRGKAELMQSLNLSYLLGGNILNTRYDRATQEGRKFVLKNFYNINNTVTKENSQWSDEKTLMGVYSDLTFDYNDYLFLGVTVRQDWSSTLPLDNNTFLYPSVNLGFVVSELFDVAQISFLKLRASYAETGNDAPIYSLSDTFSSQTPNIAGKPRFTLSNSKENSELKPERTKEFEVGLDSRFMDNMISFDFGYYTKKSIDQIISQPVSHITGYSSKSVNLGEVQKSRF